MSQLGLLFLRIPGLFDRHKNGRVAANSAIRIYLCICSVYL